MCWWTSVIARGERAVENRVIVSGLVAGPASTNLYRYRRAQLYTRGTRGRDKLIANTSRPDTLLLLTLKTLKYKSLLPKNLSRYAKLLNIDCDSCMPRNRSPINDVKNRRMKK